MTVSRLPRTPLHERPDFFELDLTHPAARGLSLAMLGHAPHGLIVHNSVSFRNNGLADTAVWTHSRRRPVWNTQNSGKINTNWFPSNLPQTISYWIVFNSDPQLGQTSGCNDGSSRRCYIGRREAGAGLFWGVGSASDTNGSGTFNDNTPYNLTLTMNGLNSARAFSNGVQIDSLTYSFSGTSANAFYIGQNNASNARQIDGYLADFFLWNRVLSDDEILSLFSNPDINYTYNGLVRSRFQPYIVSAAAVPTPPANTHPVFRSQLIRGGRHASCTR